MTRITVQPASPKDARAIHSTRASHDWGDQWIHRAEATIENMPDYCVSFYTPERGCVGIGGIVPLLRGSAEAWTIVDDSALSMPALVFAARQALKDLMEKHRIVRMQAMARGDDELHTWHTHLGFAYECTLKQYDDGVDYHVYVRFS